MKTKILGLLLALMLICLLPVFAQAAGTVAVTHAEAQNGLYIVTITWTADASAATVPTTTIQMRHNGYLVLAVTDPGAVAPTPNYDITLTDNNNIDIMGGELADRSATASEQAVPKIDAVYGGRYVSGDLSFALSNNAVNSATGILRLYIAR